MKWKIKNLVNNNFIIKLINLQKFIARELQVSVFNFSVGIYFYLSWSIVVLRFSCFCWKGEREIDYIS